MSTIGYTQNRKARRCCPILTTIDDARNLVAYLKNKPTGATVSEIKAAVGPGVVDGAQDRQHTPPGRSWKKVVTRFKLL